MYRHLSCVRCHFTSPIDEESRDHWYLTLYGPRSCRGPCTTYYLFVPKELGGFASEVGVVTRTSYRTREGWS